MVSDFAEEVSSGVNMAQRQVRVMGANVAGDQPDKTMVLVDLVPMQVKFDNATAFSAFESLWSKKISLKPSVFGDYEILYVVYPGQWSWLCPDSFYIGLLLLISAYFGHQIYYCHSITYAHSGECNIKNKSRTISYIEHVEILHY